MRRLSCRLVPMTYSPPSATTRSRSASSAPPSRMSVPRPAMLVEMVTAPGLPARATRRASAASFLAFSTSQATPSARSRPARRSDSATVRVPTSIGRPSACTRRISSTTARSLASRCVKTTSGRSTRIIGRCVGTTTVSRSYSSSSSSRGVLRGPRHAAQERVAPQVVPQGHRAQDLAVRVGLDALLRLERGLQPVRPVAVGDDAAGKLVDHADAPVAHEVVDVAPQQHAGVQGAVDLGQERVVRIVVQAGHIELSLDPGEPRLGQLDAAAVLVAVEVDARREPRRHLGEPPRRRLARLGPARDDHGHPSLVDEQAVGLVDQGHVERPVHYVVRHRSRAGRAGGRSPPPWR